jgi:hypothetical protein
MKKISFLIVAIAAVMAVSCGGKKNSVDSSLINNPNTANGEANGKLAKIEFTETSYNFGEIIQGQVVEHVFKFKNTGDNDLVIAEAKGSCGCTVPEYPKTPIHPGEESEVRVKFDSTNKNGHQEKTVTIVANTQPNVTTLTITGDVVVK